ncbi:DNA/RNA non-specific endonuclease [Planctomycetota bacterium]
MKRQSIQEVVASTALRMPHENVTKLIKQVHGRKPLDLVPSERIRLRETRLTEAVIPPSRVDLERILGSNDLVDINYLVLGLNAAQSVCRVVLRDRFGRQIGYGTGFKIAPHLLMTNHHVLEDEDIAEHALAEFDYELDVSGRPRMTTRFALDPARFFINDKALDFAIVAISPEPLHGGKELERYGFLRLIEEEGKVNQGEFVTIIQHPSGQPKQIALRENELLAIEERMLWYQSDTAQGSSGAPVFNDSWQIVALHHSGVPKKDAQGQWLLKNGQPAGPDAEDGDIDWVANEGIRISRIVRFVLAQGNLGFDLDEFHRAVRGELRPEVSVLNEMQDKDVTIRSGQQVAVQPVSGGARITVPLSFKVSIEGLAREKADATDSSSEHSDPVAPAIEKMKVPVVDPNYDNRKGYDPEYLGINIPVPSVRYKSRVAKLDDGSYVLPYEHFSVVMDKKRRLAIFTASNVDAHPEMKRPEPNHDYSRKGLGGLGSNDREMWLMDPRIPEQYQLPDCFYTKDGGAFDKGHLVRRDDVCWGETYDEVQRANGDTYHTTNCSPQVGDFNRSNLRGIWGKLENFILKQAKTETYCVFSGPLLQNDDRVFEGKDNRGKVWIRIPSSYWKIVVARTASETRAYAFLLEQDLSGVPLEFAVTDKWAESMVSIDDLEDMIHSIRFPKVIKDADQYDTALGAELFRAEELDGLRRIERKQREKTERMDEEE